MYKSEYILEITEKTWKVLQEIENFHELPIGVKYQAIFQSHYICFTAHCLLLNLELKVNILKLIQRTF